jgi:hypothetical protein
MEPDFDDYGLGAFLLAGSEVYNLTTTTSTIHLTNVPADPVNTTSTNVNYIYSEQLPFIDLSGRALQTHFYTRMQNDASIHSGIYITRIKTDARAFHKNRTILLHSSY